MAAYAMARGNLQPHRPSRFSAASWPRDDWQSFPAIAPRAAPAVALFHGGNARRIRAGTFSTNGRPGLLLQQREVSLPLHLARRNLRQTPAHYVLLARF